MQEKTLLKIGIAGSLLGIAVLYFLSANIVIEDMQIEKINAEKIDSTVKITGEVVSVNNLEKVAFLKIAQSKKEYVDVVVFKDKDINLTKGDEVTLEGNVEEYNNKLQIIANLVES